MIIHKTTYVIQEMSSHPNENWMGVEWALVPPDLESKAWELAPYCELMFDGGKLIGIVDSGTRPPAPEPEMSADELINVLLGGTDDE